MKKTAHHYWTPTRRQSFRASDQTIGRLTKIASHLNSRISYIVASRCQLATSTFSFSCGLHHWQAWVNLRLSLTTRICTTRSMLHLLGVFHGKMSPFHMMVLSYDGPRHDLEQTDQLPLWMESEYTIWFHDPRLLFKNLLENPGFAGSFDYIPYQQYDNANHRR